MQNVKRKRKKAGKVFIKKWNVNYSLYEKEFLISTACSQLEACKELQYENFFLIILTWSKQHLLKTGL